MAKKKSTVTPKGNSTTAKKRPSKRPSSNDTSSQPLHSFFTRGPRSGGQVGSGLSRQPQARTNPGPGPVESSTCAAAVESAATQMAEFGSSVRAATWTAAAWGKTRATSEEVQDRAALTAGNVQPILSRPVSSLRWAVGDEVEAKYLEPKKAPSVDWFPAVVTRVRTGQGASLFSCTYDLKYNDGTVATKVQGTCIRDPNGRKLGAPSTVAKSITSFDHCLKVVLSRSNHAVVTPPYVPGHCFYLAIGHPRGIKPHRQRCLIAAQLTKRDYIRDLRTCLSEKNYDAEARTWTLPVDSLRLNWIPPTLKLQRPG